MVNKAFDFKKILTMASWLVEDLIPLGHFILFISQSGVGKSLVAEGLAATIVHGQQFLGRPTVEGDVLLIDQDTPRDVLERRLKMFSCGLGSNPKHRLYVHSQEDLSLAYDQPGFESSLVNIIQSYPSVVLVIIDSLLSVCSKINPDKAQDMMVLAKLKSDCLKPNLTIIINHHISEKKDLSASNLMTGNPRSLAMCSSVINQQADTYFILAPNKQSAKLEELVVRPIAKRQSLSGKPYILKLVETEASLNWEIGPEWEEPLDDCARDILDTARLEKASPLTVLGVHTRYKELYGKNRIRDSMKVLEVMGKLTRNISKSNLHQYYLAEPQTTLVNTVRVVSINPKTFE